MKPFPPTFSKIQDKQKPQPIALIFPRIHTTSCDHERSNYMQDICIVRGRFLQSTFIQGASENHLSQITTHHFIICGLQREHDNSQS